MSDDSFEMNLTSERKEKRNSILYHSESRKSVEIKIRRILQNVEEYNVKSFNNKKVYNFPMQSE